MIRTHHVFGFVYVYISDKLEQSAREGVWGKGMCVNFMPLMQPSLGTLNSPSSRVVNAILTSYLEVYELWDW